MNNPVMRSSFFATPESYEQLDEMIRRLSESEQRAIAYHFTMLAFNLANKLVEDEINKECV